MFKLKILLIFLLLFITTQAFSQDVPLIPYNEEATAELTSDNLQYFAQFEGTAGDVVFLQAEYEDFTIANIELDLRDSVGRTVGFREEYIFNPFVIAELPSDGLYTVVITAEEAGDINFIIGKSGYLEDGVTATILEQGFQTLFLIRAEDSGDYIINYERTDGDLGTDFALVTFSEFFTESLVQVSGTSLSQWSATVRVNEGDTYVVFLSRTLFGSGEEAEVTIQMQAAD